MAGKRQKSTGNDVLEVTMRDPMDLKPNPRNAKVHTEKQLKQIEQSIREFRFLDPVSVDENDMILAGHGRTMAAKRMGLTRIPVIKVLGLTEEQKAAYTIAHNQLTMNTGWDTEMLALEIAKLDEAEFNLGLTALSEKDIDKLLNLEEPKEEADPLGDAEDEIVGAIGLKDHLSLPAEEWVDPYQIPRLREDMLGDFPEEHIFWIGGRRTADDGHSPLLYVYGSDSTKGMDPTRTTVCFYTDDKRFERVWDNLPKVVSKFLNAGIRQVFMPNYSMWAGEPRALHIYNTYRCRYIARYMQECGIRVIPDINFSDETSFDIVLPGMPVGAPCLAIQIQTFDGGGAGEQADRVRSLLGHVLETLRPGKLLVYAGEPGLRLGREICDRHKVAFLGILNRAAHMRGDVASNAELGVI